MSQFHRLTALVCFCFATLKATSWEQNSGHCQTSVLPDFIQITRTQFAWQPLDPTSTSFGTHVLAAILSLPARIHLSAAPMQLRWFQEWRSEMRKASRRQRHTSSTIPLIPLKQIGAMTRQLLKWSLKRSTRIYFCFEIGCGCFASSCHRLLEMWLLSHEVQHLYIRLFWYLLGTVQARLYCSADRPDARSGVQH